MNSFDLTKKIRNDLASGQITWSHIERAIIGSYEKGVEDNKHRVAEAIFKHSHGNIINKEKFIEELGIDTKKEVK